MRAQNGEIPAPATSAADLRAPKCLAELPWAETDKTALENVLLAACLTAGQDTVILVGAPGSGRSTLLQEVIPAAYTDVMLRCVPAARATGVPRQFRDRCVLSLYTQKVDATRFRNQLASFPFLQIGRPWHRLVLCDDVDAMLDAERAALVDLVDAPSPATRMRLFLTCASLERLPPTLVRRAMIFRLPDLRIRDNRLRAVNYAGPAVGLQPAAAALVQATASWLESGRHLADLWNDLDAYLLGGGQQADGGGHCAVNDSLVEIWRRLCFRYPGRLPLAATRAGLAIAEHLAFVPESRSSMVALEPTMRRLQGDLREIEWGQFERGHGGEGW